MKYTLIAERDVDPDGSGGFILNLPHGWCFADEDIHTRGYDTMSELRKDAQNNVVPCDCEDCLDGLRNRSAA